MAPSANQPPTKTPAKPRDPITHLLMALQRTGWLDNAAGRAATGLDAIAVLRLLKQLVVDGHAQVEGQGRTTRYVSMGPRKRRG